MKKLMLMAVVIAAAAGLAAWLPARAQTAEEAAVRAAVEHYFRAHATGLGEHHRKVFHPDARLFAVRDGKYWTLSSDDYIARSPGKPAADEAERRRAVEMVDISGNAAVAKVVLDYPEVKFTDYMSLLKIDGEWKIVNKTFHAEPKAKK